MTTKTDSNQTSNKSSTNPYLGLKEWDDRYRDMAKATRNWQVAFFMAALLALILAVVVARLALHSKWQPYVLETCKGVPQAMLPVAAGSPQSDQLVQYAIDQFILNSRTIVADTDAQKLLLTKVYAFSADNALRFLHDYFEKNNPFDLAAQYITQVEIVNTLQISPNTWQVTWDETQKNPSGGVNGVKRWMATLTYEYGEVNPQFIAENPFGIYITNVSWSPLPEQSS